MHARMPSPTHTHECACICAQTTLGFYDEEMDYSMYAGVLVNPLFEDVADHHGIYTLLLPPVRASMPHACMSA